ncbi:hypothetical protein HF325_006378 [Metschnikowia pulcherrima]|uniref:Uncharacterized protein n=1 Tax=Metschnikowia pulcherrima TaxID=27326 RepID=A0A8H7GLN6_9ASCO|nr:hypothetical protein HF325_006378 [Metschnikowia pulcherrima]
MATVTSISSQLPYSRRVSFNNLRPDDLGAGGPPDVTKFHSYSMTPKEIVPKTPDLELSKLFSNYSLSSPATSSKRRRLKLPEPPSKLILKNKLSTEQLRLNIAHAMDAGASFNTELNDLVLHPPDSVPKLELARVIKAPEPKNNAENDSDSEDDSPHTRPTGRRKLYSVKSLRDRPGFLQNGDHLVVAALVPLKFVQTENKSSARKKDSAEQKVQKKCESILSYILENLPDPNLRLKITVELVMDIPYPDPMTISANSTKKVETGTKFMIGHLFKQYQPTLVVVGNKSTNLNFKYPRRMSRSTNPTPRSSISAASSTPGKSSDSDVELYLVKLSSYMVRYSTVPVVMVGNSTVFHQKSSTKTLPSVTFTDESTNLKSILDTPCYPNAFRHNSFTSEGSIESFCGEHVNDGDSNSLEAQKALESSTDSPRADVDPFAAMLLEISKKSLADLNLYLKQIKSDRLPGHLSNSRVHQAYVSMELARPGSLLKTNSSGATGRAYKVRSLISYNEEDEKRNEKMISEKKLRKSISRNSAGSDVSGALDGKSMKKKKKSFLQKIGLKKS